MHDDELSVVTGTEMLNYDENDIEACDTVKNFIIHVASYLSRALDYMWF